MSKHHLLRSQAVILKGNKVLLQRRSDVPIWDIPGGEKLKSETLEECAVREALEETGLHVTPKHFVGHYSTKYWKYKDDTHVYLCTVSGGTLKTNDESLEQKFFLVNDLPKELLWINRQRIKDAVSGKKELAVRQNISAFKFLANVHYNPIAILKMIKYASSRII